MSDNGSDSDIVGAFWEIVTVSESGSDSDNDLDSD